ncbi:hypothetical protein, partial [Cytobacillus oceanisediminis]|uniref:hypothetical protein n=1 Tax=Cytobacillus oceanisediminis TaxID=665099 RepID=UPI001CCAD676
ALDNLNSNHWCVCQERLRASPLQKGKKKKTSGYFFIEVLTLPFFICLYDKKGAKLLDFTCHVKCAFLNLVTICTVFFF